jgi:cation diffusion facilitator family transporter
MRKAKEFSQKKITFIGYLEGILSLFINVILFIIKYWAGIKTASLAIIADAWHSLSDSFTSIIVIFGFRLSSKPADKKHPFGHGRAELISSIIIGTLLAVVGVHFFIESIEKLKLHESAKYGNLALIIMAISIILKEGMAQFAIRYGKMLDSKSLIADGWHHRSDSISSVLILIGILFGSEYWWIDGVLGIIVSLFIFFATYKILKESVSSLLGEEPEEKIKAQLEELINKNLDFDVKLHHLHLHHYGNHKELTFHIYLDPEMNLLKAHDITDMLEDLIRENMNIEATIHVEPAIIKEKRS